MGKESWHQRLKVIVRCVNVSVWSHSRKITSFITMCPCIVWWAMGMRINPIHSIANFSFSMFFPSDISYLFVISFLFDSPLYKQCSFCQYFESTASHKVSARKTHWNFLPFPQIDIKYRNENVDFVCSSHLSNRLIPKRDVTNFLLIHTLFGTTLYIYSRPHLQALDVKQRIAFRWERERMC